MMKTTWMKLVFAGLCFAMTIGCGGDAGGVIDQPEKTPEELAAEMEAYNAEMDADSELNGETQR
ncbi:hypothetical protein [Rubripirellula reticaptiva]|uniref:Secreted protein n=1 Tax=Rubripirellula reticaptiva TaxID=2528013 RepID=A0A5C6F6G8_9BACT|nr:hypothetical protein [Rubripirellula reticaptiva]TWU56124.1 hypothetical protein Poly59_24280 [Rubripirellula reticaptiva]